MCMLISESRPKAKKVHDCMAYEWLDNSGDISDLINLMTFSEKRAIVIARRNHGKILPGQEYVRQFMDWDGEKGTYRAIPKIHAICSKYNVFEDC